MAYLKINGFHTGVTGNARGIGDFLRRMDAGGIPFLAYCQEGTTSLVDAQKIIRESDVPHNAIFRRVKFPDNQGGHSVPDYNSDPKDAATKQWISHRDRFPAELDPSIIWSETYNELRKEVAWADWIGELCYETAVLAMDSGFKWIGPGYSAGTPDEGSWDTPGMQKFLKLASEYPEWIGVALHEYSLEVDDIWFNRGHHIGRFRYLVNSCKRNGIDPIMPIFFTEWGWGERGIPNTDEAIKQIIEVGEYYAQYPNVKGAAIWTLTGGWGDIDNQVNSLMEPLAAAAESVRYPDPDPDPDPHPGVDYVVIANLIPQSYDLEEAEKVLAETFEDKQTITPSADDAGRLVKPGKPGSFVRVWDPQEWKDNVVLWLKEKYGVEVKVVRTKPIDPPIPDFPIPQDRDEMPLLIDVSKYQDRNHDGTADDLDFVTLRDVAKVRGVMIRVSDSATVDYMYDDWLAAVSAANLPHGNYHRLSKYSPASVQFETFMSARIPGILGDWLDVEKYGNDIPTSGQVREFEALYKAATGEQIGIYTNYSTWRFHIQLTDRERPLWLANYEMEPGALNGPVAVPQPWQKSDWTVTNEYIRYWQYGAYPLPGTKGAIIDQNVFHGSELEFAYLYPKRPIEPGKIARVGLHASADGGVIYGPELNEFKQLQPGVIKVLSSTSAESVSMLATEFPRVPFIIRAFLSFGGRKVTPQQFVEWTLTDVLRTVGQLHSGNDVWIELHNEPNLTAEGLGSSWANGSEFETWFLEVLKIYRREIPGGKFLYPGLSPGSGVDGVKADSFAFMEESSAAVNAADGLAVHAYWATQNGWSMEKTIDEQLRPVITMNDDRPIWITECSNNKNGVTPNFKADEYAEFMERIAEFPAVRGVTFFVASASNPDWNWETGSGETWVDVEMGGRVRDSLMDNAPITG